MKAMSVPRLLFGLDLENPFWSGVSLSSRWLSAPAVSCWASRPLVAIVLAGSRQFSWREVLLQIGRANPAVASSRAPLAALASAVVVVALIAWQSLNQTTPHQGSSDESRQDRGHGLPVHAEQRRESFRPQLG